MAVAAAANFRTNAMDGLPSGPFLYGAPGCDLALGDERTRMSVVGAHPTAGVDVNRTFRRPTQALQRDRGARGFDPVTALKVNWRLGWLAAEMRPKFVPRMTARKRRRRPRRL